MIRRAAPPMVIAAAVSASVAACTLVSGWSDLQGGVRAKDAGRDDASSGGASSGGASSGDDSGDDAIPTSVYACGDAPPCASGSTCCFAAGAGSLSCSSAADCAVAGNTDMTCLGQRDCPSPTVCCLKSSIAVCDSAADCTGNGGVIVCNANDPTECPGNRGCNGAAASGSGGYPFGTCP